MDRDMIVAVGEVCELIGVRRASIIQAIGSGRLPARKSGGVFLIRLGDLEDYLDSRQSHRSSGSSELLRKNWLKRYGTPE